MQCARAFIYCQQCVYICVCECVCFGMLSSAAALGQLKRYLVYFSHLCLCDICLADTFVSFVALARIYSIYIAFYMADVAVIAMRQLSAIHSAPSSSITIHTHYDYNDDHHSHTQHEFYEGIRIKIVYCVYLLQTSSKKRPKWIK